MEFRVLGSLEVVHDTREITPSAAKVRGVLAMLVLRHNQIVSTREFVDELWGERPPPSAHSTLQTYIYKLRKTLGRDGREPLVTKPYGYLLQVDPGAVDLHDFERRVTEGRDALERGDAEGASRMLVRALDLWRGPALANLTPGELLSAQITRLEESRLRALDLRLEADLRRGRHRELISELKELIITHPLNEEFYAKLMTALHASGRRAEALEVFQGLRRQLVDQLGLEPSPQLCRLQQRLLTSDAGREAAGAPARLAMGRSAAGSGHLEEDPAAGSADEGRRHAGDRGDDANEVAGLGGHPGDGRDDANRAGLRHDGRGADGGPLGGERRNEAPPAQLPPDIADFVGRAEAREWLADVLERPARSATAVRVVCLTGMPGVGKTALAVHAAHRARRRYPSGQLFARLTTPDGTPVDPGEVLGGFLRAAGVPAGRIPADRDERGKLFRTWSAGRRALVVLDDACGAEQVQPLLPGSAECVVLVTSRFGLHGFAGANVLELDPPDEAEGLELLALIIGQARVDDERKEAERVVRLCGGLPLALRCAGSRLAASQGLALRNYADRLDDPATRLDELCVSNLDVRAALAASYARLDGPERSLFRLLGLLRTPDVAPSHAAVLLGCESGRAARLLARLAEVSLLRVRPGDDGEVCYSLHELVRLYARECLDDELDARTDTRSAQARPAEARPAETHSVETHSVETHPLDRPMPLQGLQR